MEALASIDSLLFLILPYVAFVVCVVATFERYRKHAYSCSSHSSQFLENRQHFWGIIPFHYGVLVVLIGHLVAALLPGHVLAWNAVPIRLYLLEATGLAFGILAIVGLALLMVRRASIPKVRTVTSRFDWLVYSVLLVQLVTGVLIAVAQSWGSSWFAAGAAPYLWSLIRLQPDLSFVAALPFVTKLHIASAFVLVALFPFSRLVHVLDVPNPYLWRRPQVVRWYRSPVARIGGRP
jgi:nitrate reductase gamma subunit